MVQDMVNYWEKGCVFNKGLKILTEDAALISKGRLFHTWGAAREKARSAQSLLEH